VLPLLSPTTFVLLVINVVLDMGSSAAQSVVLMAVVAALTVIQFRCVERRVTY